MSDSLWNDDVKPVEYGGNAKYADHVLEQYKLCVEMADRISSRRAMANAFFLTLHTLLIGAIGFAFKEGLSVSVKNWLLVFPLAAVLALCYTWWRLIKSYRQLNTAKYKVVGDLETRLPASPYWRAEWTALGKGKDPKLYRPLTAVENWVPLIFGIIYLLFAVALAVSGYSPPACTEAAPPKP